ncbi:AP2 domain protein [compost metagenome]
MPYSQEATEGIAFTGIEKKLKKEKQKKAFRHNKSSGKRGVSWHTQTQKWRVSIMIQKKIHYSFHNDLEEAIEAANKLIEYRNTLK